jgi:TonB family protein
MFRCFWPSFLIFTTALAYGSVSTPAPRPRSKMLAEQEQKTWKVLTRASQFSDVPHISGRPQCENVRPPQELTTPDPLVSTSSGVKVKVSFIIGTDGHVHSPLILESAGPRRDRNVLQAIRTWRYRPAMCNGVPTETEGKIEFSSH